MTSHSSQNDAADGRPHSITTTPSDPAITEPIEITLTGFAPNQRVTLTASFEDLGSVWTSEATFEADTDGTVSLTESAPIDGSYTGTRPMGLIQFAERTGSGTIDSRSGRTETTLAITAESGGETILESTITRTIAGTVEEQTLDPKQHGLAGRIYQPDGGGPHPAIVALHGSGGEPYGRKGRVLASNGFVVLALRYWGGPAPVPEEFAEVPVSYVGDAFDYLHNRDTVAAGDIGLIAASRGTELALLTAAHRDDVGGVVAYAPSAYAWPGESESEDAPAAWRVDGESHPIVPHPGPDAAAPEETDDGIRPRTVFEACLANATEDELAAAALPVDGIDTDVVLISGDDDGVWPASAMAETIVEAMEDAPGSATHHSYEEAGHSIFLPYHPTTARAVHRSGEGPDIVNGGTVAGNANADRDSWQVTTRHFYATNRGDLS
jgi:dienelactone hydrolase